MKNKNQVNKKYYRISIFLIGILATLAYRLIVVLNHYGQIYVAIAWYIGTIGFILYFAHRYQIEKKRNKLIKKLQLKKKISEGRVLNQDEKKVLVYIFSSLKSSLSQYNYVAIFVLSALALLYAIFYDLINLIN
jgi:CDP-diglyceride synthetase